MLWKQNYLKDKDEQNGGQGGSAQIVLPPPYLSIFLSLASRSGSICFANLHLPLDAACLLKAICLKIVVHG